MQKSTKSGSALDYYELGDKGKGSQSYSNGNKIRVYKSRGNGDFDENIPSDNDSEAKIMGGRAIMVQRDVNIRSEEKGV